MIIVINDNRVTDVEKYLPLAKAFARDAVANDKGCISMEVTTDPSIEGRVVYVSHFETKEDFEAQVRGETFGKHVKYLGQYFVSAKDTILQIS